jgi:hypothetical protein
MLKPHPKTELLAKQILKKGAAQQPINLNCITSIYISDHKVIPLF